MDNIIINKGDYVIIKFKKPARDLYHSRPDCPPRERREGCYGDCVDCYHRDCNRYEGYLKQSAKTATREGKCPKCSSDLMYCDSWPDKKDGDNFRVYEVECESCKYKGKEWWKEVYHSLAHFI